MTFDNTALERVRVAREMMQRRAFERAGQMNQLRVTNWEAPTEIGCFDAAYDPELGEYNITIKCFFDFKDPAVDSIDTRTVPWDGESRRKYKRDTIRIVKENWSDRYLLKCTKPGWRHYQAKVTVTPIDHPVRASAHFVLEATRVSDTGRSQGGGVGWSAVPPKIDVDSKGLTPKDQEDTRKAIFEMRERMLKEAIKSHDVRVIDFTSGSSTVSTANNAKLVRFGTHIARLIADDVVGLRVYVYGSTSGFDIHGRANTRATRVADIIRNQLGRHRGCVHTLTSLTKGKKAEALKQIRDHNNDQSITSTSVAGAVVFVHTPHTVTRAAIMNYIVMVHEFGHVLGLPDEYAGRHHPQVTNRLTLATVIPRTLLAEITSTRQGNYRVDRLGRQQLGMITMKEQMGDSIPLPLFMSAGEILDSDRAESDRIRLAYTTEKDRVRDEHGLTSRTYRRWKASHPDPGYPTGLGSSSIMYGGMDVMPAHYLTIWSSLADATSDFLAPTDWTIVPSPRNPDGNRWFNT